MSSFDAALRVIVAARAIRIVQVELVGICWPILDIKAFPLTDACSVDFPCASPPLVCAEPFIAKRRTFEREPPFDFERDARGRIFQRNIIVQSDCLTGWRLSSKKRETKTMSRKAKKSGAGVGVLVMALLIAIVVAPKGSWTIALVFTLVCVSISALTKKKQLPPTTNSMSTSSAESQSIGPAEVMPKATLETRPEHDEEFLTVTLSSDSTGSSYRIAPPSVESSPKVHWINRGEAVDIAGTTITGGMFFLGTPRRGEGYQGLDACAVVPNSNVAAKGSESSVGPEDYWLSYNSFSAAHRRTYIQWLASDRSDPQLHRGFVQFYLHGLERRVLVDGMQGRVEKGEFDAIATELLRLKTVYSNTLSTSAVDNLLEFISVHSVHPRRQYEQRPGPISNTFEVPLSIRVAFGQASVDKAPVPVEWALAWVLGDGAVNKRTPVTRCAREFRQLFERKYVEKYRDGMRLPVNKTKLRAPASTSFYALREIEYPDYITSLPDLTAVTGPRNKLQELVYECTDALDAYSRFLGRNPDAEGTLESTLLLPVELWQESARLELETLVTSVASSTVVTTFGNLFERFKAAGNLTRDKLATLARVLGEAGVAMEPDVRISGRTPKNTDFVALYTTPPSNSTNLADETYLTLALMVDMAASIAMADGAATEPEIDLIYRQIESWSQMAPRQQDRLKARVQVQIAQPPTLASLKKRLEPLSVDAKRSLATLLIQTANADGVVSPAEVKLLEKVYQMLGLDPQQLYRDLHGNAVVGSPSLSQAHTNAPTLKLVSSQPTFTLDSARIEALQKETAKVSAMLAGVFADEESGAQLVSDHAAALATKSESFSLLGMDDAHSAFLRLLLTRPKWTRAELVDAASDLEMMLDGAIEQVNEAALDHWDEPLIDGDDPIEINQELAQRLAA
ncbi:TerB N-terminal domain-containing protein [Burkholderia sp. SIMBA_043]|uniref:tellurite resistance TerB family protein n=2 Tax=Pseudomonadota TaxID=1224 RepID=UPI00130E1E10|nr:TerB N-terminal domain-containing protein [Burkholderia vietnamiensis]UBI27224.1 TerB N-terminal domain-containing protein [Burkholderia vietnamiensis]